MSSVVMEVGCWVNISTNSRRDRPWKVISISGGFVTLGPVYCAPDGTITRENGNVVDVTFQVPLADIMWRVTGT